MATIFSSLREASTDTDCLRTSLIRRLIHGTDASYKVVVMCFWKGIFCHRYDVKLGYHDQNEMVLSVTLVHTHPLVDFYDITRTTEWIWKKCQRKDGSASWELYSYATFQGRVENSATCHQRFSLQSVKSQIYTYL